MRLRLGLFLAACLLLAAGVHHVTQDGGTRAGALDSAPDTAHTGAVGANPREGGGKEAGAAAPPSAEPEPRAPVAERLADLVAAERLRAQRFGVSVTTADGTPVFDHSAGVPLVPASTQKLVVAAAALSALGPDFRYTTTLHATSPPGPDGVLHGDLVLVGSGDPALGSPTYAQLRTQRPRTPLEALADAAVAAGLTRVTGGVLGDPRAFPHQPEAPGWLPRYLEEGDTSRSSGLTADGGRRLFVEGGRLRSEPAADPAATAAATLHGLLVERGVILDGSAAATLAPPPAAVQVGRVSSPPLLDLLRSMVQGSDNHLADAVFRTIGAASGDASWAGAAAATRQALVEVGVDPAGTTLADGSGLSRSNRLPAAFLTALDARMTTSRWGAQWESLQAVAGESGTLRRRLAGSVAAGRLRGKTGSLEDVVSLAGAVVGPDGARYHFAVMGNDLDGGGKQALTWLSDLLVLVLAEDLYDCRWTPVRPPPQGADLPAPHTRELVCAA